MGEPGPGAVGAADTDDRRRLAAWAVLVVVAAVVIVPLVPQLHQTLAIDLGVYRMGGRALLDGDPLYEAKYEWAGLPFTYTPFAAMVFAPFALLRSDLAITTWTLLSIAALVRSCWLVVRSARDRLPGWASPLLATAALTTLGLATEPVRNNLDYGQVNLVIMWLVLEDLLARTARRSGGVLVGIATGIKIIPGVYLALLAVTGRVRQAVVGAVTAALTVVAGFVVVPDDAWRYWTGIAYDAERVGVPTYVGNQSLQGLLARVHPPEGSRTVWLVLAVTVVAAVLVAARRLWADARPLSAIAVVTLGGLLASPISWSHHWVWIVVVVAAVLAEPAGPRWARWSLAVATTVVVCSRVIWVGSDAELTDGVQHPAELLTTNAYVLTGLALLAWFCWIAARAGAPTAPTGAGAVETVTS